MSEPIDIIMNNVKVSHVDRVRTLSEEYYSRSLDSSALTQGTSPISKRCVSSVEMLEIENIYLHSDECIRSIMEHCGVVSYEHHIKNRDVKQIHS
jgi:hypothetical protein